MTTSLQQWLAWSLVAAVVYLAIVAIATIAAALRAGGRRRDDAADDQNALSVSRFTIPVSVIVPVGAADRDTLARTIRSALELSYPELEVIVVIDRDAGDVVAALTPDWQLEANEFFYRRVIHTADVRRIYRSNRDARLMVIDKAAASHADAVNCGVNVARYRYVVAINPDVVFDADALLRLMASPLADPRTVLGASSHVERGAASGIGTVVFDRLASARALMATRLVWRHLQHGLGPHDGVVVWRRDALLKVEGFSSTAADPDLDMMIRLQTVYGDADEHVERGIDIFGHVESQSIGPAFAAAARRQLAALQGLGGRFGRRGRALDLRTLAFFVNSEILTPLTLAWLVVGSVASAAVGGAPWSIAVAAIAMAVCGGGAVSAAALLLRGSMTGAPQEPELRWLLAAAPFEFLFYRPVLAVARLAAVGALVTPRR